MAQELGGEKKTIKICPNENFWSFPLTCEDHAVPRNSQFISGLVFVIHLHDDKDAEKTRSIFSKHESVVVSL